MREVVRTRAPVRGLALRETEHGNYRFESIWLPFGGGEVQQVLGLLVAKSCEVEARLRQFDVSDRTRI